MNKRCIDLAGKDVVLISGSGRSGTSWLANICNVHNEFRYLFEPLNPDASDDKAVELDWLISEQSAAEQHHYLEQLLLGDINSAWISSRNKKWFARRRLIKEIRSNLMLPWIGTHYPWVKTVWIIRNPLSVAASRKTLSVNKNWVWKPSLQQLLSEDAIKSHLNDQQYDLLSKLVGQGVVQETIGDWCINNLLLPQQWPSLKTDQLYPVFYEELVQNTEMVIGGLFAYLDIKYDDSVLRFSQARSETCRRSDDDLKNKVTVKDWQQVLTEQEQMQSMDVLNQMGIKTLYPNACVDLNNVNAWQPVSLS